MKTITLTINQNTVIDRVATITEYTGGKSEDGARYDRERTVDEDKEELLQFWDVCRSDVVRVLSHVLKSEEVTATGDYNVTLELWDAFKDVLWPMMRQELENYFVYGLTARWYVYSNKELSDVYAAGAVRHLEALKSATIKKTFERGIKPF